MPSFFILEFNVEAWIFNNSAAPPSPDSSMKEIAYLLGFDDLAHFSKFFKNSTGVSFTSYKRGLSVAI